MSFERKLTIEPGGVVPWHSHGDRPAIIYIAEGEIVEYASNCALVEAVQSLQARLGPTIPKSRTTLKKASRGRRFARAPVQARSWLIVAPLSAGAPRLLGT